MSSGVGFGGLPTLLKDGWSWRSRKATTPRSLPNPETRTPKPRSRNPEPGTRISKIDTRNLEELRPWHCIYVCSIEIQEYLSCTDPDLRTRSGFFCVRILPLTARIYLKGRRDPNSPQRGARRPCVRPTVGRTRLFATYGMQRYLAREETPNPL